MNRNEWNAKGRDIPGCVRRLTNFERYLLWSAENCMSVVARIMGDVDEKKLMSAIDVVRGMHPLMGARVVVDGNHEAWFSTDNVPGTAFRTAPRASEGQWFDEVRHEYQVPFKPDQGPLIRFALVYSPQVSELIAFAEHCICDGVSLAKLLRDILACYSKPHNEVRAIYPPATTDYIPKADGISQSTSKEATAIDHYNDQWRKRPHYFLQEDFLKIHEAWSRRTRHNIVILQLEPEETSRLVDVCHENEVAIGSSVTAAFLAAYQEVMGTFPENRRTIQVPFDLRRHIEGDLGDFLGFFVGAFKVPFTYNWEKSLFENAKDLHMIIQKHASMLDTSAIDMEKFDPTLVDAFTNYAPFVELFPEAFSQTKNLSEFAQDKESIAFAICRDAVYNFPGTIASNIGRVDIPEIYGKLRLDRMFAVAPASKAFPLFLAGISVSGRLTFSLNYIESAEGDGASQTVDMIRIRNRALEYLGFPEKANGKAI
ncbi:MAG TPA: condensation domain-containing protein [Methanotrichaceae archaeon]|nr:condensation domain-containing protein [Methanotrichaceae archaeon]